jgi:heat shock protein HtpX
MATNTLYNWASSNVKKTWILMSSFLVLIIILGWLFSRMYNAPQILYFAVIFSFVLNFISYFYGDKIALSLSGAHPIEKSDYPELVRIVENLSITAGIPTPKIYLIPDMSPNAFATGRDKEHSSIAVTLGLLNIMNKQELEGVIAHEISHITNKDILISSVVVVLVGIISMLADFLLRISFWSGGKRDDKDRGGNLLFLLGIVAAILAPIAATLIQLAISRKREFLADASGALLTRYPEGLASALEKIKNYKIPLSHANSATAHLYIANPLKGDAGESEKTPFLVKIFMTHPPLEERIKKLREMDI